MLAKAVDAVPSRTILPALEGIRKSFEAPVHLSQVTHDVDVARLPAARPVRRRRRTAERGRHLGLSKVLA
jgi:hypothetical protein